METSKEEREFLQMPGNFHPNSPVVRAARDADLAEELLEALEDLIKQDQSVGPANHYERTRKARNIIAKARGKVEGE